MNDVLPHALERAAPTSRAYIDTGSASAVRLWLSPGRPILDRT